MQDRISIRLLRISSEELPGHFVVPANDEEIELQITGVYKTESHAILTGKSEPPFTIAEDRNDVKAFFADDCSFVILLEHGKKEDIPIEFRWEETRLPASIDVLTAAEISDSILPYLNIAPLSLLKCFPEFSDAWHKLLEFMILGKVRLAKGDSMGKLEKLLGKFLGLNFHIQEGTAFKSFTGGEITISGVGGKLDVDVMQLVNGRPEVGTVLRGIEVRDEYTDFSLDLNLFTGRIVCFLAKLPDTPNIVAFRFYDFRECAITDYRFNLDLPKGKSLADQAVIMGWGVDTVSPDTVFDIRVLLDNAPWCSVANNIKRHDLARKGISDGTGGFRIPNPVKSLARGNHWLAFKMPDNMVMENVRINSCKPFPPLRDLSLLKNPLSVIMVANDNKLSATLEKLREYTPAGVECIIVDNDSLSPESIKKIAVLPDCRIVKTSGKKSMGECLNLGIAETDRDVIVISPNAEVFPRWLENMLVCAHINQKAATVSALSPNCAVYGSRDSFKNADIPENIREWSLRFRKISNYIYPMAPELNLDCVFIRKRAIAEIGLFNEDPEAAIQDIQADFSMRAIRKGWKNIIDDRSFIYTDGRVTAAHDISSIQEAYPEYKSIVDAAEKSTARNLIENCVQQANQLNSRKPAILFVVSTNTGGTITSNLDMIESLSDEANCYQLQCDGKKMWLSQWEDGVSRKLEEHVLKVPVDASSHMSPEYDTVVADWLFQYDIDIVHIHHLIWHSLNLLPIAKQLGCRVLYMFHDFYAISPNLNLLDDCGVFLGNDFHGAGTYHIQMWNPPLPSDRTDYLEFWKKRLQKYLAYADHLITFSRDAFRIITENLPELQKDRLHIIPHGRDFKTFLKLGKAPIAAEKIRIIIPGNISPPKGSRIIEAIADYDKKTRGLFEFHILGETVLENTGNIITHGTYEQEELNARLQEISPHFAFIPSIWHETWCHTLTEMWACGLPTFAFNIGTVAERIKSAGCGWLIDSFDVPEIHTAMAKICLDADQYARVLVNIGKWQETEGAEESVAKMMRQYRKLYQFYESIKAAV